MISAEERAINDAFERILIAPVLGVKINLLKTIIQNLEKLQNNESDNFNLMKIAGQLFYDLNNIFSEGHFTAVVKCFDLIIQKSILKRVVFKDGPIRDLIKKIIDVLEQIEPATSSAIFKREKFVSVYINLFLHKKMTNELINEASNQLHQCMNIILTDETKERYPQMLKMLTRMLKADPKQIVTDEKLNFWFRNIVPLLIDEDLTIQTECIKTLEHFIPVLQETSYETHPNWTEFKLKITNDYTTKIGEIATLNENWYKIWSICFRLMGRELLSQAKEINKFLRVLEVAFRKGTHSMKTSAYKCWYTFVHTFIQYDELHGSKRVKLICTPFKAFNERTQDIYIHKFRVWWYVLCNLQNVLEYVENIIEPFFKFCFGPLSKSTPLMRSENDFNRSEFPSFCSMSIVGMLNLLGEPTADVLAIQQKLDISIHPTGIITKEIFDKIPELIINACGEATVTIAKHSEKQTALSGTMWKNLLKLNSTSSCFNKNFDLIVQNLEELFKMIPNMSSMFKKVVLESTKIVSKHITYFPHIDALSDTECVVHVIESMMDFLLRNEAYIAEVTATLLIKNLMTFQATESPHFPVLIQSIIKIMYTNSNSKTSTYIAKCKLQLWSEFYPQIQKFLQTHANDFFREQQILNVNQMLMVPLIFVGHIKVDFMKPKWAKLFQKQIKNNKINEICNSICKEMQEVFECQMGHFDKLLEFFLIVFAFFDSGFEPDESPNVMKLLDFILTKRSAFLETDDLKSIIDNLNKLFKNLNTNQISNVLQCLKEGLTKLSTQFNERKELKTSVNEMKTILKSKFGQQNKINGAEIIQALFPNKKKDENDGFVAIPSNWKLNPDKLTDHQREKMKERRSDIPALYSNLSNSTESSSIKPWQPVPIEKTPPIKIIAQVIPGKAKRKYSISGRDEQPATSSKPIEDEETSSVENDVTVAHKNDENILANNNKDASNKNIRNPYESAVKLNVENRIKELNIVDEKQRLKVERELRKMRIDTSAGVEQIEVRTRRPRRLTIDTSPKKTRKRRSSTSRQSNDSSDLSIDSENTSKNESIVNDSNEEIACSQDVSQSVFTKPKRISRRVSLCVPKTTETEFVLCQKSPSPIKFVKLASPVKSPVKSPVISPVKFEKPPVPKFHMSQMVHITNPEIIESLKQFSPPMKSSVRISINEPVEKNEKVEKIIKISEMETEPNTEIIEPVEKIYKISEMETEPNTSTISSSDVLNTEEKTAEFLNNTLNISPIKATEDPPIVEDLTKNVKLTNGTAKEPLLIQTKDRIIMKPIISSPVNRKKLSFPAESPSRKPLVQTTVASSPSQSRGQKMMEMMKINKCSTPIEPKKPENHNLLTFNKVLPSPMASPSISILKASMKRKLNEVEQNPSPLHQPDSKRSKRVSFNHPESVTREYIVVPEEKRDFQPLNRCLNLEEELDDTNPQISIKELLKHKSSVHLIDDDDEIRKSLGVEDGPADIMPIDELNEIITPPLVRGSESRIVNHLEREATVALDFRSHTKLFLEKLDETEKITKEDATELINAILRKM